jgi:hypothetical protein
LVIKRINFEDYLWIRTCKTRRMFVREADLRKRTWPAHVSTCGCGPTSLPHWLAYRAFVSTRYCTGPLFCSTTRIALHSHHFAWLQTAQRSPQFLFAQSVCPRVLVQCIAVNIRFVPKFGILPLGRQSRVTLNIYIVCCTVNCVGLAVRVWRASKLAHMTSLLSRAASHWPLGSSGTAPEARSKNICRYLCLIRVSLFIQRLWCLLTRYTAVWT